MKKEKRGKFTGDEKSFIKNWKVRPEKFYNHWTKKEPQNQVQLAFRNHWSVFRELMKTKLFNKGKRCLEVGCGRGTISAYFSDAGYDCTLLDISSNVIDIAQKSFKKNKLQAKFKVGDVNKLPFENSSFDIVVSIGLLEHFKNIERPIQEQIRVLDTGGLFIGYIVPKYINNIQKEYKWINDILKVYAQEKKSMKPKKKLFRSDAPSDVYMKSLKKNKLKHVGSSGIYPLPMISHSIEFPFTLMPADAEKKVVKHFKHILNERRKRSKVHPWLCKEGYGQAFLVWGFK